MGVEKELDRDGGFLNEAGLEKVGVVEPDCEPELCRYLGLLVLKMLVMKITVN